MMGRGRAKQKIKKEARYHSQPDKVTFEQHESAKIFPKGRRAVKEPVRPTLKVLSDLADALAKKRQPKPVKAAACTSATGAKPSLLAAVGRRAEAEAARTQVALTPAIEMRVTEPAAALRLDVLRDDGYLWRADYQELLAYSDAFSEVFEVDRRVCAANGSNGVDILLDLIFESPSHESFTSPMGSGYLWRAENEALFAGFDGCNHKASAMVDSHERFFGIH